MAGRGRPKNKPVGATGEPNKEEVIPEGHNAQELRNAIPPSSTPPQQQQLPQPEQAAPPNAIATQAGPPAPANAGNEFVTPANAAIFGAYYS